MLGKMFKRTLTQDVVSGDKLNCGEGQKALALYQMYGKGRDGLKLYHYSGCGDYLCSAREVDMFMTSSLKWVPMSLLTITKILEHPNYGVIQKANNHGISRETSGSKLSPSCSM